jgi:predicted transcriptional regulator of viral defense system
MSVIAAPDQQKLYRVAEQQAGHFSARQARSAGFTYPLLTYYTKVGEFERVAQGIYRLSRFPEMPHADLYIAWLRTGPNPVISHDSALGLYDLSDILPSEIHITVPRHASERRRGIRLHTNRLSPDEVTWRAGLPVTTVPRTIADVIRSGLPREQAERAIREALDRGLVTRQTLRTYARQRGAE